MSQLLMEKNDLERIPRVARPRGYTLRHYRLGDETALARIYASSELGQETADAVRHSMMGSECFRPERLLLVEHRKEVVGTAAAWIKPHDPGVGYLHMVGVLPGHRGKHLGRLLVTAALAFTRGEGFACQRLETDDWREAALALYIDLGYYPLYTDNSHPDRWSVIAESFHRPDLLDRARDLRPLARA